jgi:cobalt-zinc-cadmium efflux system membrane fusion protein
MNKTILYHSIAALFLLACQSTPPEQETHEHDDIIPLSEKVIEMAGITFGEIENREIEEWIDVAGEVDAPPENRASISTPYGGYVTYVRVYEGDKIKKGQVLARLSDPVYVAIQSDYLEALVEFEFLQKDFERKKELLKNKSISDKQFDEAKRDYDSKRVSLNSLEASLRLAGIDPEQVKTKGIVKEVEIKSPIAGYARALNLNLGKHMEAGEVLLEVIDPTHIHLELAVFPNQIHLVDFKQKIYFRLTGTETEYTGFIKLINQSVDAEKRSITVHAHPDDEELLLMPGTFVQARIVTGSKMGKSIPAGAVVKEDDHYMAFRKVDEGVEIIHFKAAWANAGWVDASELPAGIYVTAGAEKLQEFEAEEH